MADNNNNNGNGNNDDDEETTVRKILASLDVRRKAMENEADAIHSELTTPPSEGVEPMGIDTPLVDGEGYPRADIDVYRARTQRHRFSVLKTDHRECEKKIEALLVRLASLKVRRKQDKRGGGWLWGGAIDSDSGCVFGCVSWLRANASERRRHRGTISRFARTQMAPKAND